MGSINSNAIRVNPHMQTSDENIYAVGDAVESVDYLFPHIPSWVKIKIFLIQKKFFQSINFFFFQRCR